MFNLVDIPFILWGDKAIEVMNGDAPPTIATEPLDRERLPSIQIKRQADEIFLKFIEALESRK